MIDLLKFATRDFWTFAACFAFWFIPFKAIVLVAYQIRRICEGDSE